jgi:hypothetical protein
MAVYDCATTWFLDENDRALHVVFLNETFEVHSLNYFYDAELGYGVHVIHWGKKEAPKDVAD